MVNITYGTITDALNATSAVLSAGTSYGINGAGTDLIATLPDGTVVAYDAGDIAWVLTCSALVWLMIPGVGLLYSGLVRRKNALSLLLMSLVGMAIISFQWFFWGYSLAFSTEGGPFIGNLQFFGLRGVLEQPVLGANNKVPQIVYMFYQGMFAALVPSVALGAIAERGRMLPAGIFMFCWTTIVYCPVARWIWSPNGWAFQYGVLDYAGGGPVEIASGVTGLVYSIYLGKRRGFGTDRLAFRPHNIAHIVIGTVFLWVGWLGFNGGSTFAANFKAALAIVNTNLAGSVGGLTWMLMDYRLERKWSVVGFCTGAIVGLVAITPFAGFGGAPASVFIGIVAAVISNVLTTLKGYFKFDDAMDIYACHGVAGIVGLVFTGVFAQASVAFNDGFTVIPGGWLDHNYRQVGVQLAYVVAVFGYVFVVSYALMFIIDHIPGLHFRISDDGEIIGVDEADLGEYCYDYASVAEKHDDMPFGTSESESGRMTIDSTEKMTAGAETSEVTELPVEQEMIERRETTIV